MEATNQETTEQALTPEEQQAQHEQEMIELAQNRLQTAEASAEPTVAEELASKGDVETTKKVEDDSKEEPKTLEIEDEKHEEEVEDKSEGLLTPDELSKYSNEFIEKGSLSEDSYKELEAKGIDKSVVDAYIEGQAAIQQARVSKVYNEVGGADAYVDMVQWARENWSQEQIDVFNKNVNSNDEASIMFSVNALKAEYERARSNGLPKRALRGTSSTSGEGATKGYTNKQEMFKAMRNPAYGKDPVYTKQVEQKIKQSKFK